jgi:hypothetical protein
MWDLILKIITLGIYNGADAAEKKIEEAAADKKEDEDISARLDQKAARDNITDPAPAIATGPPAMPHPEVIGRSPLPAATPPSSPTPAPAAPGPPAQPPPPGPGPSRPVPGAGSPAAAPAPSLPAGGELPPGPVEPPTATSSPTRTPS